MQRDPVDRTRRFLFVSRVVTFCLLVSSFLVVLVGSGVFVMSVPIVETYIGALVGLATAMGLAYVTGSVVDYNGGIVNLFSKDKNKKEGSKG